MNLFSMMKNAAGMRSTMKQMQKALRAQVVTAEAGNGLVTVTARGDASLVSIKIDARAMDPAHPEKLEKLVLQATEAALDKAKTASATTMKDMMGDMGLPKIPGLFT